MKGYLMVLKAILGISIGGGLGYLWYRYVGCASGSCPITSNPWSSSIYGIAIGLMITLG
jgi:Family of unknown function (DUF6132)